MNVVIKRERKGTTWLIEMHVEKIMKKYKPKGCPFKDYSFLDLLEDLIKKNDWRLEYGKEYSLKDFLAECNDMYASTYGDALLEMEAMYA